jgi:ABC-type maltose transport system permease subunit
VVEHTQCRWAVGRVEHPIAEPFEGRDAETSDILVSLVLVQSDAIRPLTAGIQSLRGMWQTAWSLVAAASILAAIPPVLVFFLMQRHLIAGLTYAGPDERRLG